MSKKRRLLRTSKWLLLFLVLTLLAVVIARDRTADYTKDDSKGASFTFVQLFEKGIRKVGRSMAKGQSVMIDLLAGDEPVFFETEGIGNRESGLPFLLEEDNALALGEDSLKGLEEENRLYQERLEEEKKKEEREEEEENGSEGGFIPAREKSQFFNWENYEDMDKLIQGFYTVDSTTEPTKELFQVKTLLETDCTIDTTTEGPQILLYHTHSQEAFVDSVQKDTATTIVGAGEVLTRLLEGYGYKVLHHKGEYDVESRDYAYSNSLPAIEQILKENPSIQAVIDLHRDAVAEDTRLVTQVAGRPTAKVMFFNGLSRSKKQGDISYLYNPYLKENLAFSFQMKVLCDEYYPGFARNIYLRAYRYNMHVSPRTLLIELGAQTNTVEEIHHALDPLAQILDMVLGGMDQG
ncbi:MAG: stage II sporulation protein P [Lachnospiraceae bacterium]